MMFHNFHKAIDKGGGQKQSECFRQKMNAAGLLNWQAAGCCWSSCKAEIKPNFGPLEAKLAYALR